MHVNFDAVKKSIKRLGTVERKHWRKGLDALQNADSPLFDGVKKVRSNRGTLYELRPAGYSKIRIIFQCDGPHVEVTDIWKKGNDITRRDS